MKRNVTAYFRRMRAMVALRSSSEAIGGMLLLAVIVLGSLVQHRAELAARRERCAPVERIATDRS